MQQTFLVEQGKTEADPEAVYARWLALQVKSYQEKLLGVLCEQAPAALQVHIDIIILEVLAGLYILHNKTTLHTGLCAQRRREAHTHWGPAVQLEPLQAAHAGAAAERRPARFCAKLV